MEKFTALITAFMAILCAVNVNGVDLTTVNIHSRQSTTSQPPSVQGWVEFLNQGMSLLPSSMALEELLGTMGMIPSLDENTFGIVLQSLNIDVPNSSELSNMMAVLKNLLKIVSWGSTQLPDGNIGELVSLISTMDEQSLEVLFQSLNVDMLSSTQFADAQRILKDLITSVHGQSTTANINSGQSTTFQPPSVQGWAEFLNQGMSLLPSSMTLEELLGTMSIIPSLDEQTFAGMLQSLNIDVPNSSELSNTMTVLKGLLRIVTWGSSQLPGGNVGDLVKLISNMDENSLQLLLQSLNVDTLSSAQFDNALAILQELKKSVSEENVLPPGSNLNDILNIISTMDKQNLQELLESSNIDILDPVEISGILTVLQNLHNLISAGNIQIPNGDINEFLNMMTIMDVQSLSLLLQKSNINGIDPLQLSDALTVLQSLQSSTSGNNSHESNGTNPNLINNVDFAELSSECSAALSFIVSEVAGQNKWALQIIDSWGKPPSGLLDININWLGSYDQCLAIEPENQGEHALQINYCVSDFEYNNLRIPFLGMCLPKSCIENDVKIIANSVLHQIPMDEPLTTNNVRCKKEIEHDTFTIVAICVCSIFLALMVFATFYDVFIISPKLQSTDKSSVATLEEDVSKTTNDLAFVSVENSGDYLQAEAETNTKAYRIDTEDSNPKLADSDGHVDNKMPSQHSGLLSKIVLSFSVWTNGRKLLSTKPITENIGAITGIRFITMAWIILTHTYYINVLLMNNINMLPYYKLIQQRASNMPVVNGMVSVDTFFVLSGLLLSYYFMKEMKREKGRINWFMFYFHRFWRITPTYMLVIMMDIAFSRYYADGPSPIESESDNCKDSWWTNLLYVNNFIKTDKKCYPSTWFLANAMQFYIISPLLLVPLYFSKKIGAVVSAIFVLGGTIGSAITAAKYPPTNTLLISLPTLDTDIDANNFRQSKDFFNGYYIKPYAHTGPYVLGIVTGYILFKTGGQCKINKSLNLFIWIITASLACLVVYGLYEDFRGNRMSSELFILYYAVHKTVWGACICWVVFACATGNGGFVNTLLSWSPFIFLNRLTFCAYLVHPMIISAYCLSLRQGVYLNDYSVIYMFIGHLIMTMMVAFVASLVFESPMIGLEKAILKRNKKTK